MSIFTDNEEAAKIMARAMATASGLRTDRPDECIQPWMRDARIAVAAISENAAAIAELSELRARVVEAQSERDVWHRSAHADRARSLAAEAQNAKLVEALEKARDFLKNAPIESGYCCCGDIIESHNIGSGHSPVDAVVYAANQHVESIDATLAEINAAKGNG